MLVVRVVVGGSVAAPAPAATTIAPSGIDHDTPAAAAAAVDEKEEKGDGRDE